MRRPSTIVTTNVSLVTLRFSCQNEMPRLKAKRRFTILTADLSGVNGHAPGAPQIQAALPRLDRESRDNRDVSLRATAAPPNCVHQLPLSYDGPLEFRHREIGYCVQRIDEQQAVHCPK